ncbi:MAG: nitrile hydratase accessory protein [Pseudomonadota bacterium]
MPDCDFDFGPDHERVFEEPWQAQLFAMTVAASDAGLFDWPTWADTFGAELAARGAGAGGNAGYYEAWLAAFSRLLSALGHADDPDVAALARAWQEAARATPHGVAIELSAAARWDGTVSSLRSKGARPPTRS